MILRKGSQAEARRKIKNYRTVRNDQINDQKRQEYYADRKHRKDLNRKALKYFQKCLERELPEYTILLSQEVFDKWAQNRYAREACLAHNDIEKVFVENRLKVPTEVIQKCRTRMDIFIGLSCK